MINPFEILCKKWEEVMWGSASAADFLFNSIRYLANPEQYERLRKFHNRRREN